MLFCFLFRRLFGYTLKFPLITHKKVTVILHSMDKTLKMPQIFCDTHSKKLFVVKSVILGL